MKDLNVTLINAPTGRRPTNYATGPSLACVEIGSSIIGLPGINVTYIDGNYEDFRGIQTKLEEHPDIIGISSYSVPPMNYEYAKMIGGWARKHGSIVVMGGFHATAVCENIVSANEKERFMDYIITGNGIPAFRKLVLEYQEHGRISSGQVIDGTHINHNARIDPLFDDSAPVLDFKSLLGTRYLNYYMAKQSVGAIKFDGFLSIYTAKGCQYRKCSFCSLDEVHSRVPYHTLEKSLENLAEVAGKKNPFIYITDPDFGSDNNHLKKIIDVFDDVREKTGKRLEIYAFFRPDSVMRCKNELIDSGVRLAFLGVESGSNKMLKHMRKGTTVKQNLDALDVLGQLGIDVCSSFVIGTPAETRDTLKETVDFVEEISGYGNVVFGSASLLEIIPGTPLFSQLINILEEKEPSLADKIKTADSFNEIDLAGTYLKYAHLFPEGADKKERPSKEEMEEAQHKILKLLNYGVVFANRD